jgi:hypothetical protein
VHDRATSERFVVYSPRFVDEFRAGHHAGLWYLRATTNVGVTPQSAGFPTVRAAVDALRTGQWGPSHLRPDHRRPGKRCRVMWS